MALSASNAPTEVTSTFAGKFQQLSLRTKATVLAIAIGTVPVVAIGLFSYSIVSRDITEQALERSKTKATQLSDKINRFMFERFGDIQILSNFDTFTDPSLKATTTQKAASLERFIQIYGVYNNITAINLDGTTQFTNTKSDTPAGFNFKDQKTDYFLEVSNSDRPVIGFPRFSKITKKFSLFAAAPIKINGATNAIIRTRIPIGKLNDILKDFAADGDQYYIADKLGKIFASSTPAASDQADREYFAPLAQSPASDQPKVAIASSEGEEKVIGYLKSTTLEGLPNLGWTIVVTTPTRIALVAQRDLLTYITIGTFITIVLVTALAVWLANQATKPIEAAAAAVEKIGKGQLTTRLAVTGADELAVLGNNINLMTEQLEELQNAQKSEVQRIEVARQEARSDADASAQEQKTAKEKLQSRALELLMEVDPISRGNLTIRAQVTDDEIGTIADSYNATVGSLRRIVTQVQTAAQQVTDSTTSSEMSVQELSTEALRQAEEISDALDQVRAMSKSIRTVTSSAEQAEAVVQQAVLTIQEGDTAMNLTVDGILAIQDTVATTSEKVKRLGEASVNISRVVNLISGFAEQTNLLALNAAIEAARAGAQGRGFAVVADEVQALAQQSADATAEIEELVAQIQTGTGEVILAMETGTKQVNTGTRLVGDARKNLTKIAEASAQIRTLVAAIAFASTEQSKASDQVTETITDVAAIALNTSTEANQVSNSFKDLLEVAQQLQKSVGQFKV